MPTQSVAKRECRPSRIAAAGLVVAALALLAACRPAEQAPPPEVRPVRVLTIADSAAGGTVSLTGTVQAQTEINQGFRIDGRLIERLVDIGDTVRPGQLIARLDPQNEESSLQTARAQLAAAQAQAIQAEANYLRMRELVAEDAVSRAQFEQAEANRKAAIAQVDAAQSQLVLAQNRLGFTRLVSDVAGIVTARGAEPGEVVSPGRMIVQVARDGARDAVFDVPAQIKEAVVPDPKTAAGAGRMGKPAEGPGSPDLTVVLAMNPQISAHGRVREVAPRADPVTGTFAVRVRLIDPPEAMRLGSTVTGRLQLARAPAIELPATALVRADGRTAVWLLDKAAGTVSLRTIELRNADAATVQVASGLKPGDVVVTAGVQALRPGQKVRPLETQS